MPKCLRIFSALCTSFVLGNDPGKTRYSKTFDRTMFQEITLLPKSQNSFFMRFFRNVVSIEKQGGQRISFLSLISVTQKC